MTVPATANRFELFLGNSSPWYKYTIIAFLIANPLIYGLLTAIGVEHAGFYIGWLFVAEFIFTLAMALQCYPLMPGGLLGIQAMIMGLTDSDAILHEIELNLPVLLLLVFMVSAVYFLNDLLVYLFNSARIYRHNRYVVAVGAILSTAFLSAFLDALTVTAVFIVMFNALMATAYKIGLEGEDGTILPQQIVETQRYVCKLVMYLLIGTAVGGVCTLIGEPQNILIANAVDWNFNQFILEMAHVTVPVAIAAVILTLILEKTGWFGYDQQIPEFCSRIMQLEAETYRNHQTPQSRYRIKVQALVGVLLVAALLFHVAEVGFIGIAVIILVASLTGIADEHDIGPAFKESLPFTTLLVVFFALVSLIHEQHLFEPITSYLLTLEGAELIGSTYIATGLLSAISDNVFVGSIYISTFTNNMDAGHLLPEQLDLLAVAVNTGTNIPSISTPNGQAAFLFALTSSLAPRIGLSYMRMVWMALPYAVVLSVVGWVANISIF